MCMGAEVYKGEEIYNGEQKFVWGAEIYKGDRNLYGSRNAPVPSPPLRR